MNFRIEKDSLGEKRVPADAYYGVQTQRAVENFPISGLRPKPRFIDAVIYIKKAAAGVNSSLGLLDSRKARAIIQACDEILGGKLRDQFVVDVYQAGAGTSHNMNANEVIANRAIEILGGKRGDYSVVHPNDDVNMSQSTNDVIPTAIHLGALLLLRELLPALESLEDTFAAKERELNGVLKSARTHLQDAVPIRLGQEFGAYARNMKRHRRDIEQTSEGLRQLGIGGTAAGTGLNAHPEYRKRMVDTLSGELGETLSMAEDYFEAMQSMAPSVAASGALRNLAQDLIRIANDLRLLGSGPKTGLFEIRLPAVQPGSSIMPGKVNPSIAEMVDMVGFQVLGCDLTVTLAAQAGQLDLNVMMPVIAYNLFHSIEILTSSIRVLAEKTVAGIVANEERCREYAEGSMSIVTVLNPHIGYSMAAEVAKEYLASGKSIREILLERKLFTPEELDAIFDLRKMTEPGIH